MQILKTLGRSLDLEWIEQDKKTTSSKKENTPSQPILEQLSAFIAVGDVASILEVAESKETAKDYPDFSKNL